jgi:hypothetical protein
MVSTGASGRRRHDAQPRSASRRLRNWHRSSSVARRGLITTSRPRLALAAAALAGIAPTACGTSTSTQAPSPAASGPAPAATSAPPPSSAPAASAQPSATLSSPAGAAGGAPECGAAQLKIAYTDNKQIRNGALDGMSHADHVVMFTNEGRCGVPDAGLSGYRGPQCGRKADQAGRPPGRTAGGDHPQAGPDRVGRVSANTASCITLTSVSGLLVTAPDQRTSTRLGPAGKLCLNSLGVGVMERGNAAGLKL